MKLKRRPRRRRRNYGPWTVNTSDRRVIGVQYPTSTSFKLGPYRRDARGNRKIKLPWGFYIPLGGKSAPKRRSSGAVKTDAVEIFNSSTRRCRAGCGRRVGQGRDGAYLCRSCRTILGM